MLEFLSRKNDQFFIQNPTRRKVLISKSENMWIFWIKNRRVLKLLNQKLKQYKIFNSKTDNTKKC